jgi:hypothetical protein
LITSIGIIIRVYQINFQDRLVIEMLLIQKYLYFLRQVVGATIETSFPAK